MLVLIDLADRSICLVAFSDELLFGTFHRELRVFDFDDELFSCRV